MERRKYASITFGRWALYSASNEHHEEFNAFLKNLFYLLFISRFWENFFRLSKNIKKLLISENLCLLVTIMSPFKAIDKQLRSHSRKYVHFIFIFFKIFKNVSFYIINLFYTFLFNIANSIALCRPIIPFLKILPC